MSFSRRAPLRCLACLLTAVLLLALPSSAFAENQFVFNLRGRGHGVGLSQWGAHGFADRGYSYSNILRYYFPGTALGSCGNPVMRVAIDRDDSARYEWQVRGFQHATTAAVPVPLRVTDGTRYVTMTNSGTVSFKSSGQSVVLYDSAGNEITRFSGTVRATVASSADGVMQVIQNTGAQDFANTRYRGTLRFVPDGTGNLRIYNDLVMEDYLRAVVPWESKATWPAECLKAQSVCARSYAYASRRPAEGFDVWTYNRSQAYVGWGHVTSTGIVVHETANTNAAIAATQFQAVTYNGNVVLTLFDTSSGGMLEDVRSVWFGPVAVPYLRGGPDPYEAWTEDPNHATGDRVRTASEVRAALMAKGLSVPSSITNIQVTKRAANTYIPGGTRAQQVVVSGPNASYTYDTWRELDAFVSALNLNGTRWFYVNRSPDSRIRRRCGQDRYSTSVALARAGGPSAVAVVASGQSMVDALAAAGLSAVYKNPVVLTHATSLPWVTEDYLKHRANGVSSVIIVGSGTAVGSSPTSKINSIVGSTRVRRIYGTDRYSTAAAIAKSIKGSLGAGYTGGAIVVNDKRMADAASASGVSAALGWPVLYVQSGSVPAATMQALQAAPRTRKVWVVGSTAVVGTAVESQLRSAGFTVERVAGADRYGTSLALANKALANGCTLGRGGVFSGTGLIDALSLGPLVGKSKGTLLMTPPTGLSSNISSLIAARRSQVSLLSVAGSDRVVADAVLYQLDAALQ